jgi:hypothetical protein
MAGRDPAIPSKLGFSGLRFAAPGNDGKIMFTKRHHQAFTKQNPPSLRLNRVHHAF